VSTRFPSYPLLADWIQNRHIPNRLYWLSNKVIHPNFLPALAGAASKSYDAP
jgi:hypothetical protein